MSAPTGDPLDDIPTGVIVIVVGFVGAFMCSEVLSADKLADASQGKLLGFFLSLVVVTIGATMTMFGGKSE